MAMRLPHMTLCASLRSATQTQQNAGPKKGGGEGGGVRMTKGGQRASLVPPPGKGHTLRALAPHGHYATKASEAILEVCATSSGVQHELPSSWHTSPHSCGASLPAAVQLV